MVCDIREWNMNDLCLKCIVLRIVIIIITYMWFMKTLVVNNQKWNISTISHTIVNILNEWMDLKEWMKL